MSKVTRIHANKVLRQRVHEWSHEDHRAHHRGRRRFAWAQLTIVVLILAVVCAAGLLVGEAASLLW